MRATFKKLGASSVSMPPTEIYMALKKNILNGYIHPFESLKSFKLAEVAKYTTILNASTASGSQIMMNWDSYNRLPPDIKQIFDETLPQLQADMVGSFDKRNKKVYGEVKAAGHAIIELPPAELAKFYRLLEEEARDTAKKLDAKGLPGTKIFEYIRSQLD